MNAGREAGPSSISKLTTWAAVGLLIIGAAAYFGAGEAPPTAEAPSDAVTSPSSPAGIGPAVNQPVSTPGPTAVAPGTAVAPVRTRAELAAVLAAQGLRPEPLIDALRQWRIAHGYLGPDPLVDDRDSPSSTQYYDALDPATLRSLADGGDMVALQMLAARTRGLDVMTALKLLAKAAEHGSTASMFQAGSMLNDFSRLTPAERQANPEMDSRLLDIQGGNPDQDFRELALAWGLAAIRQDGPAAAEVRDVEWIEEAAAALRPDRLAAACGRSLAVFAEITAARRSAGDRSPPPVFVAPAALYERLPCSNSIAPVSPPPETAGCSRQPVAGDLGRAMDLWICPQK